MVFLELRRDSRVTTGNSGCLLCWPTQFVVIHTVKGFGVVNKAEVDVFLELSYFFYDPTDVGNLISVLFSVLLFILLLSALFSVLLVSVLFSILSYYQCF